MSDLFADIMKNGAFDSLTADQLDELILRAQAIRSEQQGTRDVEHSKVCQNCGSLRTKKHGTTSKGSIWLPSWTETCRRGVFRPVSREKRRTRHDAGPSFFAVKFSSHARRRADGKNADENYRIKKDFFRLFPNTSEWQKQ